MAEGQKIVILGVGPGHPQFLTVMGSELIWQAQVVAGFATVLQAAEAWIRGEKLIMDYQNQEEVLEYVANRAAQGQRCVVCAAGDPCVSAGELIARVRRHWERVEVVPGISSIQLAAARCGIALEESLIISLHRRADVEPDMEELVAELKRGHRHLIVLPRPWELMPTAIAQKLLEQGIPNSSKVWVLQDLTLEGETQTAFSLEELATCKDAFSDRSILAFPRPGR